MCTKKCTSGKFSREKVHGMCTNVDYVLIIQVKLVSLPRWKKINILQSYPNVPYLLYCTIWYSLPASSWADFGVLILQKLPFHTHRPLLHETINIDHTFASRHSHWPNFAFVHPPPHSSTMTNACVIVFTLLLVCCSASWLWSILTRAIF